MTVTNFFNDHVASRMKSGEAVLADLTPHKCRVLHATLGLAGELQELYAATQTDDYENLIEELGDTEFYLADYLMTIDKTESDIPEFDADAYYDGVIEVPDILDIAKKYVIYGKPLNVSAVLDYFSFILHEMSWARTVHPTPLTRDDVKRANIEKLAKRYPTGYTNAAAIERADKV